MVNDKIYFRLSSCLFILGLIVVIGLGCAAKKPFWEDEKSGYILNYRPAVKDTWKYQSTAKQKTTMEQMGQTMETTVNTFLSFTMTGFNVDKEDHLRTSVVIDTIRVDSKTMGREMIPDLSGFVGKSFALVFSRLGKELEMPGADSITVDLGMMLGGKQSIKSFFRNVLPDLPAQPIKIGQSWTKRDTTDVSQAGLNIQVHSETMNTLEAIENVLGYECLKIASKSKSSMEGAGQQMGANLNFEGEMEGSGIWYFAFKEGLFVKSNLENFLEGTIVVSGPANMSMPMNQESRSEVILVK